MMDFGWASIKKLVRKELASEVMVVCMYQTSKSAETIIIPAVVDNNQPMIKIKIDAYKWNCSINTERIGFVSTHVCAN